MLRNVKDNLRGHAIRATDGVIGEVEDLYFDDDDWAIRYLVVDTGTWLSGRKVLISPLAMGRSGPNWKGQLDAALTMAQIEKSPDIDTRKPVSRQHEADYIGYYGYSAYWGGAGIWGMGAYPGSLTTEVRFEEELKQARRRATLRQENCHLRSCRAVTGYHIHAKDGDIGHVDDFLVDDRTWAIRYLVVNTSNWWVGHQMLVSPRWIEAVNWADGSVSVDLTRQVIKDAPPYPSSVKLTREEEHAMYSHYGRAGYWTAQGAQEAATHSAGPGTR